MTVIERISLALESVGNFALNPLGDVAIAAVTEPVLQKFNENTDNYNIANAVVNFMQDSREYFEVLTKPEKYVFTTQPEFTFVDDAGFVARTGLVDTFNLRVIAKKDLQLGTYVIESQVAVIDSEGEIVLGNDNFNVGLSGGLDVTKAALEFGFQNWLPNFEALIAAIEAEGGLSASVGPYELEVTFSGSIGSFGGAYAVNGDGITVKAALGVGGGIEIKFKRSNDLKELIPNEDESKS